jgi:hypothetical protein
MSSCDVPANEMSRLLSPPTPASAAGLREFHPNAAVREAGVAFQDGEARHRIDRCDVCDETRFVAHATPPLDADESEAQGRSATQGDDGTRPVELCPWRVRFDGNHSDGRALGICERCFKDRKERSKTGREQQARVCALFSGWRTPVSEDKGDVDAVEGHNGMHFLDVPYFLEGLTAVERALVARVTVCQRIHLLRQGMASAKGHCLSVPNTMRVASKLPALAAEVGFVVLRRRNSQGKLQMYQVRRAAVQAALEGLRNGADGIARKDWLALASDEERSQYVQASPATPRAEWSRERLTSRDRLCDALAGKGWDGTPGCMCKLSDGKMCACARGCGEPVEYFRPHLAPNPYWADVEVDEARVAALPSDGDLPGVKVVEVDDMPEEADRGPAEKQFELSQEEAHADGFGVDGAAERMAVDADANDEAEDDADESVTTSGLVCPRDPRSLEAELKAALTRLLGADAAGMVRDGQVAVGDWRREEGAPIRELATEGFFTMLAPHVFVRRTL